MKLFASDISYAFTLPIRTLIAPAHKDSVSAKSLNVDELVELSKDSQYDISENAVRDVEFDGKYCFATFNQNTVSAYAFLAVGRVEPKHNTAGAGFGGIGLRLPQNVVYVYKCFSLPEFRGQSQVAVAISEGANSLLDSEGWLITTADVNNHSSARMFEKLGFTKRDTLREYRFLNVGKYRLPSAVDLGEPGAEGHKRVEFFTP